MKLTKHSNIFLVGLALLLSLVSYTGVANHLPNEAIKTALVVSDTSEDTRFSINFLKANTIDFGAFAKYSVFAFTAFQKDYGLKDLTAFNTYTHKTLGLSAEQLHVKSFTYSTHQTLYNNVVS